MDEYIALVREAVPGLLVGVYLHGSLALGTFNADLSDIDFITITSRRCTPSAIPTRSWKAATCNGTIWVDVRIQYHRIRIFTTASCTPVVTTISMVSRGGS